MAIIPEVNYTGKVTPASSNYPYGQARNITIPGDGTGTPWEAALVNDIFGFQQSLLQAAGETPSGNPDRVGASQYLAAVKTISGSIYATLSELQAAVDLNEGAKVVLLEKGGAEYIIRPSSYTELTGDIVLSSGKKAELLVSGRSIKPEWFGATAGANSVTAFSDLISRVPSESVIDLGGLTYWLETTLTIDKSLFFRNGTFVSKTNSTLASIESSFVLFDKIIFDFDDSSNFPAGVVVEPASHNVSFTHCIFKDMVGGSGTNQQYALQVDAEDVADLLVFGCTFKNISQLGDNVTSGKGFCGGVFISSNDDLVSPSVVHVIDCTFRDIFTYVDSGLLDPDADAIRVYVVSTTPSAYEGILTVRGCTFIDVQKSAVKAGKFKTTISDCITKSDRVDSEMFAVYRSNETKGFSVVNCEAYGNLNRGVYVGDGSNVNIMGLVYETTFAGDGAIVLGTAGSIAVDTIHITNVFTSAATRGVYLNNVLDAVISNVVSDSGKALVLNAAQRVHISNVNVALGNCIEINGSATEVVKNISFSGIHNNNKVYDSEYTVRISGASDISFYGCTFKNESLPPVFIEDGGVTSENIFISNCKLYNLGYSNTSAAYFGAVVTDPSSSSLGRIELSDVFCDFPFAVPGSPTGSAQRSFLYLDSDEVHINNVSVFYDQASRGGAGYSAWFSGTNAYVTNLKVQASGAAGFSFRTDSTFIDMKGGSLLIPSSSVINNSTTGVFDGVTVNTGFTFSVAPTHQRVLAI